MRNREGNDKSNCCIVCRKDGQIDEEENVSLPVAKVMEATEEMLDVKEMEHEGRLPLDCELCGESFSTKKELVRLIIHVHSEKKIKCTICSKKILRSVLKEHVEKSHGIIFFFANKSKEDENVSEEMSSEGIPLVNLEENQSGMLLDSNEPDIGDLHVKTKITYTLDSESSEGENKSEEMSLEEMPWVDLDVNQSVMLDSNEPDIGDLHVKTNVTSTSDSESEELCAKLTGENISEQMSSEVMPSVDLDVNQSEMLDSNEPDVRDLHLKTKMTCTLNSESKEGENISEQMSSEGMPSVNLEENQSGILLDSNEPDIGDLHLKNNMTCTLDSESEEGEKISVEIISEWNPNEILSNSSLVDIEDRPSPSNESEVGGNKSKKMRSKSSTLRKVNLKGNLNGTLVESYEVDVRDLRPDTKIICSFCNKIVQMRFLKKHVKKAHGRAVTFANESEKSENNSRSRGKSWVDPEDDDSEIWLNSSNLDIEKLHPWKKIICSFCEKRIPKMFIKKHMKKAHDLTHLFASKSEESKNDSEEVKSGGKPSVNSGRKEVLLNSNELDVKGLHPETPFMCIFCDKRIPEMLIVKHLKEEHPDSVSLEKKSKESENKPEEVRSEVKSSPVDSGELLNQCEVLCKVEIKETGSKAKINMNSKSQWVECKMCKHKYSNELNLKKHVYNVHKMLRVKCQVCSKEVNKKSLDRHMKSVHSAKVTVRRERKSIPEEKLKCVVCNKKCMSLASLKIHVKNIHEAKHLKCTQCDFQGTRKQMEKHTKKKHNNEVYQCPNCQKILKSKSTLKEHMWIHSDHRRYVCDICGLSFKRTSNYHGHVKSHQGKKFQCQLCGNFFLRKRYLTVHEQTIHNYYGNGVPPQQQGYQCEVCGVTLKWKNNMLAHMRIHTGEKPYKCKICGDDFTCHGSLRTHMARHAICPEPDEESNIFIQESYFDGPVESSVPFFAIPGDSLTQFI